MAGPLFSRIREDLGLAYYVGSSIFFGMNTGLASFYLGTSPEQLKLAETEIQKEIVKLIENGIPEDALKRVKANTEARDALRNQSLSSRVRMATLDVLLGYPANHHQLHSERLSQVTKEETQQVCGEILNPETAMTIRISPEDLGIEA
jgi:zinc protease